MSLSCLACRPGAHLLCTGLKAGGGETSPEPTTAPAVSTAAPGSVFTDVPDPTKPEQRSDPSGLDFGGSLYKPNGWLAGSSAGGTTGDPGKNDGSDWQPFGYDKDKDGNLAKDKDGKPVPSKPTVEALVPMIAHAYTSINFTWGLVCGFLVMFMQAGFALVETGPVPREERRAHDEHELHGLRAGHVRLLHLRLRLMCGGAATARDPADRSIARRAADARCDVHGQAKSARRRRRLGPLRHDKGSSSRGIGYDASGDRLFLFMMVFMDTTATIPTGAMAERWSCKSFFIFGLFIGGCHLSDLRQLGLGRRLAGAARHELPGLGHGAVDFAGSGVVHCRAASSRWSARGCIGPRIGKYDQNGKPKPIPGHNIPMVMLGTFILAFGWFGFNPGSLARRHRPPHRHRRGQHDARRRGRRARDMLVHVDRHRQARSVDDVQRHARRPGRHHRAVRLRRASGPHS